MLSQYLRNTIYVGKLYQMIYYVIQDLEEDDVSGSLLWGYTYRCNTPIIYKVCFL